MLTKETPGISLILAINLESTLPGNSTLLTQKHPFGSIRGLLIGI